MEDDRERLEATASGEEENDQFEEEKMEGLVENVVGVEEEAERGKGGGRDEC